MERTSKPLDLSAGAGDMENVRNSVSICGEMITDQPVNESELEAPVNDRGMAMAAAIRQERTPPTPSSSRGDKSKAYHPENVEHFFGTAPLPEYFSEISDEADPTPESSDHVRT
ncbi:MAG: hypothetical protein AAGI11_04400 [Pseudomonadota bacterium]